MLHQLGAGVLGPVFRVAKNDDQRGPAAVKVFVFDLTPEQARACAERLQVLANSELAHPSLVSLISAGCEGSLPFLAQACMSGEPLEAVLRERGPFPLEDVLRLVAQLAAAIDAAPVFHGRLHPRDIIVNGYDVWITGHGVGPALEDCGVKVAPRRPYTAPERLAGQAWNLSADVYALGAITCELVTGRRLGATADPASFGSTTPPLNPLLQDVFAKALAATPGARYQSGTEFAEALNAAAFPKPTVAVSATAEELFVASGFSRNDLDDGGEDRRSFPWLGAAALVALGVAVGLAVGHGLATRTAQRARAANPVADTRATGGAAAQARAWTDSPVAEPLAPALPPSVASPAPPSVPEATGAARPKTRKVAPAPAARRAAGSAVSAPPDGAGTLAVRTRPEGARVFLNGRAVGITPLVLSDIAAGSHALGLELTGYRRWAASVRVGPGKRHDVTASLDRVRN